MSELFSFDELLNVKQGSITVDGISINTLELTITSANTLAVTVGTTGYRGGDTGHGGRTYLKLEDRGSTDLMTRIDNAGEFSGISLLELRLGGDCELSTFIAALAFAARALKAQTEVNE